MCQSVYMLSNTDLATTHMHIRPKYKGALNKGTSFRKCMPMTTNNLFIWLDIYLAPRHPNLQFLHLFVGLLLGCCNSLQSWKLDQFHNLELEPFTLPSLTPLPRLPRCTGKTKWCEFGQLYGLSAPSSLTEGYWSKSAIFR